VLLNILSALLEIVKHNCYCHCHHFHRYYLEKSLFINCWSCSRHSAVQLLTCMSLLHVVH